MPLDLSIHATVSFVSLNDYSVPMACAATNLTMAISNEVRRGTPLGFYLNNNHHGHPTTVATPNAIPASHHGRAEHAPLAPWLMDRYV
jgi:hypothetical protein